MALFRSIREAIVTSEPPTLEVSHGGETYRVQIRKMRGAQRFTLRVRNATADVVLTMPYRGSVSAAARFAQSHAAWIGVRLKRLPPAVPFEHGAVIPFRGRLHQIVHLSERRGTVWIEDNALSSPEAPSMLCVAGEAPHVARRIEDHLKAAARTDLQAAVATHCAKLGLRPRSITLRDPVSRWGSCSSSGALSFSWRLILAPTHVLDYLAAHEVAHLAHMNHSAKFWAVVHRLSADVDPAEAWLNAHGSQLHRYGKARAPLRGQDEDVLSDE